MTIWPAARLRSASACSACAERGRAYTEYNAGKSADKPFQTIYRRFYGFPGRDMWMPKRLPAYLYQMRYCEEMLSLSITRRMVSANMPETEICLTFPLFPW